MKGQHGPKELDNAFPEPVWKAFGVQVEEEYENQEREEASWRPLGAVGACWELLELTLFRRHSENT